MKIICCLFRVFLAFVAVLNYYCLLLFIISLTVYRKTNFLVNLYWDSKYSDSDSVLFFVDLVLLFLYPLYYCFGRPCIIVFL